MGIRIYDVLKCALQDTSQILVEYCRTSPSSLHHSCCIGISTFWSKEVNVGVGMPIWDCKGWATTQCLWFTLQSKIVAWLYVSHVRMLSIPSRKYVFVLVLVECSFWQTGTGSYNTHSGAVSPADYQSDWVWPGSSLPEFSYRVDFDVFVVGGQRIWVGVTGTDSKEVFFWYMRAIFFLRPSWIHREIDGENVLLSQTM